MAITVLAIVAVMGWRGLDSIIRARVAITEGIDQTRGMQLTFAQLESDCAHLAPASLVAGRPILLVRDDMLLLVRTVFADDQPTRVQTVAYRFVDGRITRWESPPTRALSVLDAGWRAASGEVEAGTAVTLQSGVTSMRLRTWTSDGAGWRAAGAGVSLPQASTAPNAPTITGLEVALDSRDHPGTRVKIFLLGNA